MPNPSALVPLGVLPRSGGCRVLANLYYNVEINRKLLDTGSTGSNSNNRRDGVANGKENDARPPPEDVTVRFLDWTDYGMNASTTAPPASLMTPSPRETTCELEQVAPPPRPPPPPPPPPGQNAGFETAPATPGRTTTDTTVYGSENGQVDAAGSVLGDNRTGRGGESATDMSRGGDFVVGRLSSAAAASAVTGCETRDGDIGEDPLGTPDVVLAADVVYDVK